MKFRFVKYLLTFCMVMAFLAKSSAQVSLRKKHYNLEPAGTAMAGYDPVSYHTSKSPREGQRKWSFQHHGVSYLFSSKENMEQFKLHPDDYEPQYGGWCAYAMGETGEKVQVDPETFKIIDNKLYLFYNFYFTNTLKKWNKDEARLKSDADSNWAAAIR